MHKDSQGLAVYASAKFIVDRAFAKASLLCSAVMVGYVELNEM